MSCGPSEEEQVQAGNQAGLAQTLQANSNARYADQTQVLQTLNQSLSPIVTAGPSQAGFSPEELSNMNTQAINTTGAAARNATQAAQTSLAGQGGGGTSGLASGIDKQIAGSIKSAGAGQLAGEQNQITAANYSTGRDNYNKATAGLDTLAGLDNPLGFANAAGSAGESAFSEADKISTEKNAESASVLGAIGSIGKDVLGFATGGISNVLAGGANAGSGNSGGVGNFFSGGFDALGG